MLRPANTARSRPQDHGHIEQPSAPRKLEGTALLVLHSRPGHARRDRDAYKRVVGPPQFERAELSQHYVDRGSRVVFAYTLAMLFSYQLNIDPTIKK